MKTKNSQKRKIPALTYLVNTGCSGPLRKKTKLNTKNNLQPRYLDGVVMTVDDISSSVLLGVSQVHLEHENM